MISGRPEEQVATALLVVPRSMPREGVITQRIRREPRPRRHPDFR
jgi:hypothetical protein